MSNPSHSGQPRDQSAEKPWGGRFEQATNEFVERFTASVMFDQRLYAQDIRGSIAHASMLAKVGILTADERDAIVNGLQSILADIRAGNFTWSIKLEDVHMNIESALVARIGDVGKKLHTARSRNDQVATDIRLYMRDVLDAVDGLLAAVQQALLTLAEREADTVMPGFTHLQPAQPISFGHHVLAWFEMLVRDRERFADCRGRTNVLPLGSAALAGTTFPIDRAYTAELLGFAAVAENSLDAVSDRDFGIEFCAAAATLMVHLSRISEELIIWNSQQFRFIDLPDAFCTGSSIMPQKKNPDVPELVRGKSGRVVGHLVSLITLMKGQPLAYNKDNQEDKEPLFDTADTVMDCLRAFADLLPALEVEHERLRDAAAQGFTNATDLADYLVRNGVAFRDAHAVVGGAVRLALRRNCALEDLELAELKGLSPLIGEDVYDVLKVDKAMAARDHFGGTAPNQVRAAVIRARERLNAKFGSPS
ncbi:MAG: argininosuccinate lyase [Gammaproteobacteria bacterium]|nr:argininosuccinate lyase [Gammaproteobacteria bacterium]